VLVPSARVTVSGRQGLRVFVAGATGVIGRSLVPMLVAEGHTVIGMTRRAERTASLKDAGATGVVCDVFDVERLTATVREASPDVVIHELTEIPADLQTRNYAKALAPTNRLRIEGTRNLVAAAQAAGARRLLAQSVAFAYAPTGSWVKEEAAPLNTGAPAPTSTVVGAVASLERQVLEAGGTVLRYGFLYGPGTQFARDGFYGKMARRKLFPLVGAGTGVWSFVHVDDAAGATVRAMESGSAGVYNVVDNDPATVREWLPIYTRSVGGGRPLHVPAVVARLAGGRPAVETMTTQRGASNAKARAELEWVPVHPSWRDGFRTA
jgi:2-alkyl-3-oxoalkanoate reductase